MQGAEQLLRGQQQRNCHFMGQHLQQHSMKAKKGKAGIERACSAEPSPGRIKVKKKTLQQAELGENREEKRKKDEGRSSLQQTDGPKEEQRGGRRGALNKLFIWLLDAVFMLLG